MTDAESKDWVIGATGQCLCGAVSVRADISASIHCCHCGQCQRWTGGGPLFVTSAKNIVFTGEGAITEHHASEWGTRAFCNKCGTTLYWAMRGKPPHSLAVGLFDDQSALNVDEEIFTDCRAPWLAPFQGASQSTEAEQKALLDAYLAKQGS